MGVGRVLTLRRRRTTPVVAMAVGDEPVLRGKEFALRLPVPDVRAPTVGEDHRDARALVDVLEVHIVHMDVPHVSLSGAPDAGRWPQALPARPAAMVPNGTRPRAWWLRSAWLAWLESTDPLL